MLRLRLISAAIIIGTSLTFVTLDALSPVPGCDGLWMLCLGVFLIFGSAVECVQMMQPASKTPSEHRDTTADEPEQQDHRITGIRAPALLGVAGIMVASAIPMFWPALQKEDYPSDCLLGELGWPLAAILIAQFMCLVWYFPSYQHNSRVFSRAIAASWVSTYFGGGFAFAIALRRTGEPLWGLYLLVGIILITKFADSGAYFTGRAVGRTKLCPHISPGKTVEGLIGGAVTATLAGWIYFSVVGIQFFPSLSVSLFGVVVLGVLLTLAGIVGDLVESIFKREMGVKDSGHWLPGLGGLWDVTDSLLPGFLAGYLVVMAELIKGPGQ
ncbi:MAG: phosphatidate cytidylyltransferase [Pirellulaceae bacterium]